MSSQPPRVGEETTTLDQPEVSPRRVLVVFCTYDELDNLPVAIERLWGALPEAEVLVVDDNSPDGTGDWVRRQAEQQPRLHLLARPGKLGLGTALRDAIKWCLAGDYDFLINLDADLSHDPGAAPQLLAACRGDSYRSELASSPGAPEESEDFARSSEPSGFDGARQEDNQVDVVVGSRYIPGGDSEGLAWHRRLISKALNRYATTLLRLPLTDCSGSYRCYRVATLRQLELEQLTCTGYGFLEEILVALHGIGARFREVPIVFSTRHGGHSKLTLADAWGALRVINRLGLGRAKTHRR